MRKSILAFVALIMAFAVCAPLNVEAQPGRGNGIGNSRYAQRIKERRKYDRERSKFIRKVEKERYKNAVKNRYRDDRYYRTARNDPYYNGRRTNDPYYNGRPTNDPYYNGPYTNDPYYNGSRTNDPYYHDPYYDDYYYRNRSVYDRHRNVINIGIAAGAGAVIGGILDGKKGALIGAGVGAAAGAVYTYGINPKDKRRPRIYYPD